MSDNDWTTVSPDAVLAFWFPDDGHAEDFTTHQAFWLWRMRGQADAEIRGRFAEVTEAAARGRLDHWSATPHGHLALVIVLDQFSRAVWRDAAGAFAQDIKAARLVLDALDNGHFNALPHVWQKAFCLIALGHCEGPDHLVRMGRVEALAADLIEAAPPHLKVVYRLHQDQARLAREVIGAFGRYPHRNVALGRLSTDAEEPYLAAGRFPHQRPISEDPAEVQAMLDRREHLAPRGALT